MATLPTAAQLTGNVTEGQFKSGINQLLSYLSENVGANGSAGKQVMTVSGVWTVPAGVTQVYVSQCGGGGGGASVYGCGGGGGASVYRQPVKVTPGESIACTIGAGGLGCTSAASSTTSYGDNATRSGSSGTATSFGSYITSAGGGGGISGSTYSGGTAGGVGGSAGEYFHVGIFANTDNMVCLGGRGGSSMFGVGGSGGGACLGKPETMTVGGDGIGYGAGGGGGTCVITGSNGRGTWSRGGSGSNGVIIIEW